MSEDTNVIPPNKEKELYKKNKKQNKNVSSTQHESNKKERKTIKIGTINLRKGIDEKLYQIQKVLEKEKIDILLTQEWAGWQGEEEKYKEIIPDYINFCSFKKKKKSQHKNKSFLAMNKEERKEENKINGNFRQKGNTILIKKNLLQKLHAKELLKYKDGQTLVIEISDNNNKLSIINIHGESQNDKNSKNKYFEKIEKIIKNNIKEGKIIIGGDANSVWEDDDTTNMNKSKLDKSIREFCERNNFKDLIREENKKIGKENLHTWRSSADKLTKRLDSFWGNDDIKIIKTKTYKDKIIETDHKLVTIELEWNWEEDKIKNEFIKEQITNNKVIGQTLSKRQWERYKEITGEKIEQEMDLNKKDLNEEEIDKWINILNKILDESLRKAEKDKKEKLENEEEIIEEPYQDNTNKEKEKKENEKEEKIRKFLETLNLKAFEIKDFKQKKEFQIERNKMKRGIDGPTAKLIKIKHKLLNYKELLTRKENKKDKWNEKERKFREKIEKINSKIILKEEDNVKEIEKVKKEIQQITNKLGKIIKKGKNKYRKSRFKEYQKELEKEGWKGSKKFFDKILKKYKKTENITKIPKHLIQKYKEENNPEVIKTMITDFWTNLFKSEKEEPTENLTQKPWFNSEKWERHKENLSLNQNFQNILKQITKKELTDIIKQLKNNKTGGTDELINEQIKYGSDKIRKIIKIILNNVIKNKKIPIMWKDTRIFTIYKKDDTNDPNNYRGISLLPTLYKILTKIIAKRLTKMSEKINLVDEAQGLGKKGFSAYNEAKILHNIIEDVNQYDREVHICYIDITKAYDRVERWALNEILNEINFPENLKELIIDANTNIRASVITNFGETDKFGLSRGLRQGCPLSPLLFCLIIDPMIRWIKETNKGYTFTKNEKLKISILAYMDDIVLMANSREELDQLLKQVEEYFNYYNMEISDKSVYTTNVYNMHERVFIQNTKIKRYGMNEPYKYLGFHTTINNNWEKHKTEAKEKHAHTINLLKNTTLDPRIQIKTINTIANTPLEYGFHAVPYTEKELEEIDKKNKEGAKRILKISTRCPTKFLFMDNKNGGMGIRSAKDLYFEINTTDLMECLNYSNKQHTYYKTNIQRMNDLKEDLGIDIIQKCRIPNKIYNRYWIARAIKLIKKNNMEIINNKLTQIVKTKKPNKLSLIDITKNKGEEFTKTIKNLEKKNIHNIKELITQSKIKEKVEIEKMILPEEMDEKEWKYIKILICKDGKKDIKEEIIEKMIEEETNLSLFNSDWKEERKQGSKEEIHTYSDGSANKEKAGAGIYNEKEKRLCFSTRVLGTQDSYNGELQGAIYATNNSTPNTKHIINIDNAAVIKLGNAILKEEDIIWRKVPQPAITRLFQKTIEKTKKENTKIIFNKVKGHSGIKGNEEADKRAKKGKEKEKTYISELDIEDILNDIDLKTQNKIIQSNYRKEIKKSNIKRMIEDIPKDKNEQWKTHQLLPITKEASHSYLKDKKINKAEVRTIIKMRTNLIPCAKTLFQRKYENIKSPNCLWCKNKEEDLEHILLDCNKYKKEREEIEKIIYSYLNKIAIIKRSEELLKEEIPSWFTKKEEKNKDFIFNEELENFSKLAGILGYIPSALKQTIKILKKENDEEKINKEKKEISRIVKTIHRILIKGCHRIWTKRNKEWDNYYKNKPDKNGTIKANKEEKKKMMKMRGKNKMNNKTKIQTDLIKYTLETQTKGIQTIKKIQTKEKEKKENKTNKKHKRTTKTKRTKNDEKKKNKQQKPMQEIKKVLHKGNKIQPEIINETGNERTREQQKRENKNKQKIRKRKNKGSEREQERKKKRGDNKKEKSNKRKRDEKENGEKGEETLNQKKRRNTNLDYAELHNTGEKKRKSDENNNNIETKKAEDNRNSNKRRRKG